MGLRIEICGGIAAGKTTLSQKLGLLDFNVVNESFEKHPFLKEFYDDSSFFSFETELTFLLQHYHDIKIAQRDHNRIVCDFSFLLDLAYASFTLNSKSELGIFSTLLDEVYKHVSLPDLIIYLKCPPKILLNRIRVRNREIEKSINIEFLTTLTKSIEKIIKKDRTETLIIDSNKYNFADNVDDEKVVLDIIYNKLLEIN